MLNISVFSGRKPNLQRDFTAETDILVTYEIDPKDRAIQRAIANGTTVLTEYDFLVKVLHREPF